VNTIWKVQKPDGALASNFEDIEYTMVDNFNGLFKQDNRSTLVEVVRMDTLFPRFITKEDNVSILEEVSKVEL
jgi:hypothetical protein